MKKLFACLLVLALVAGTAPLFAQEKGKEGTQGKGQGNAKRASFQEMDADKDGKVSKSEWKGRPRGFNRLDANNDGYITQEEMKSARKKGKRK